MINEILKEASIIRKEAAEASIFAFAKTYLKHYLKIVPSWAHKDTYEILHQMHKQRNMNFALAAPRDFGKSTLVTLIDVLYSICYRKEKFIVIFSNTTKLANRIMGNVKSELIGNPLIREDFPELFEFNGLPKPPRWKDDDIETRTGIKIISAGIHEASRGLRFLQYRPTLVIADDIEKGDAYVSIESIEKAKDSFNKTFLRIGTEGTNFIILGTFFHPYCLLGEYLNPEKHPEWTKRVYKSLEYFPENQKLWQEWSNIYNGRQEYLEQAGPAIARKFYDDHKAEMDEGAKSLWPEKWGIYDLMVENDNNPVVFSSERQNTPFDPKTQTFKMEELHYWTDSKNSDEDLLKSLSDDLDYIGSCDPAMGSDFSAIIVLMRDNKTKMLYELVADINRRSINQIIDDIVTYAKRFKFTKFAIESNNFQKLMVIQLKQRCEAEKVKLNIEEIKNTSHKNERIRSIHSITRTGGIKFNKNHKALIDQLCSFPMHLHDDGPDALEMAIRIAQEEEGKFQVWHSGMGKHYDNEGWLGDYRRNFGWML